MASNSNSQAKRRSSYSKSKSRKSKRASRSRSRSSKSTDSSVMGLINRQRIQEVTDYMSISVISVLILSYGLKGIISQRRVQKTTSLTTSERKRLEDMAKLFPKAGIINGRTATKGRYPYAAFLILPKGYCSGSLVAPDTVLTAAHCVTRDPETPCQAAGGKVVLGTANLVYEDTGAEIIEMQSCLVHPEYSLSEKGVPVFDLALVKLVKPSKIKPVTLDNGRGGSLISNLVTLLGWGKLHEFSNEVSPQLMELDQEYLSFKSCEMVWKGYEIPLSKSHLCVWPGGRKWESAYSGDSGGPWVVKGSGASADVQVGLASFINPNVRLNPGFPNVAARVSVAADWIQENAQGVKFSSINSVSHAFVWILLLLFITAAGALGIAAYNIFQPAWAVQKVQRNRARARENEELIPPHRDELLEEEEEGEREDAL